MSKNRNHLVPTVITNKNGTTTTVHKKPSTTETTSTTRLPKATLPATGTTRTRLEQDTARLLATITFREPQTETEAANRERNYETLANILTQYSDQALHRFTAVPEELGQDFAWGLVALLRESTTENYINDWIAIQPVVPRSGLYDQIEYIINSLGEYQKLEPQDNGHYPAQRTQQVQAITRVTDHFIRTRDGFDEDLNKDRKLMQIIHDEALRDLLTTHENPEAIADIIVTRNLTDPDQLTALHDTMHRINTALTDGAL